MSIEIRRAVCPAVLAVATAACSSASMGDPAGLDAAAPDAGRALDAGDPTLDAVDAAPDAPPDPPIDAASGPVLRVFADDYGPGVGYAPFGGSTGGPVLDAQAHTGTSALRIEVPAAGYTGGAFRSGSPLDLSAYTAVSFWARASKEVRLNVVGVGNDAATDLLWAEANGLPITTSWTRIVVPLPDPTRLTAERGLFHVAEGPEEGAYTLWLDDIQYEVAAAGQIGPPQPAIATEAVTRAPGATFLVNGASITYQVDGVQRTIATSRRYLRFRSSEPSVASVDDAGLVTAHTTGTAVISARLGTIDAVGALTFTVAP